jgi:hypothetical protein
MMDAKLDATAATTETPITALQWSTCQGGFVSVRN